ncbi:cell division protein FtsK, partial [Micromonospora sp. CPCC 206061]
MPDRRTAVVVEVRARLARARAAARVRLDRATSEVDAARARLARTREIARQRPARAAAERDRRVAELGKRHAAGLAELAQRAAVDGALAAPG